eukprot:m.144384 g.144384  ORF g.144384 m.144384 type:complete len:74 (+) comp38401_c0_seq75:562-783(+)
MSERAKERRGSADAPYSHPAESDHPLKSSSSTHGSKVAKESGGNNKLKIEESHREYPFDACKDASNADRFKIN